MRTRHELRVSRAIVSRNNIISIRYVDCENSREKNVVTGLLRAKSDKDECFYFFSKYF